MGTNFKKFILVSLVLLNSAFIYSQREAEKWKAQISLGVNSPLFSSFVNGLASERINFPSVNMGLQHLTSTHFGFKLDYGFNRIARKDIATSFKINYSRINAQIIYDLASWLEFIPERTKLIIHGGAGYSWSSPLANNSVNKLSYPNLISGLETHYYLTKLMSLYLDFSYIKGLASKDISGMSNGGLAGYNGDLFNVSVGLTFSLSGCYNCN